MVVTEIKSKTLIFRGDFNLHTIAVTEQTGAHQTVYTMRINKVYEDGEETEETEYTNPELFLEAFKSNLELLND